jgi:hypothetical protein
VIAKRRDSRYEPGRRSGAWVKMRINEGQELVIGGYVPAPKNFDSIIVGYYERDDIIYVARVRAGFVPALRVKVFERFHKLEIKTCPFSNLPQRDKASKGERVDAVNLLSDRRQRFSFQPAATSKTIVAVPQNEWAPIYARQLVGLLVEDLSDTWQLLDGHFEYHLTVNEQFLVETLSTQIFVVRAKRADHVLRM